MAFPGGPGAHDGFDEGAPALEDWTRPATPWLTAQRFWALGGIVLAAGAGFVAFAALERLEPAAPPPTTPFVPPTTAATTTAPPTTAASTVGADGSEGSDSTPTAPGSDTSSTTAP
jgi:hypothetical protein